MNRTTLGLAAGAGHLLGRPMVLRLVLVAGALAGGFADRPYRRGEAVREVSAGAVRETSSAGAKPVGERGGRGGVPKEQMPEYHGEYHEEYEDEVNAGYEEAEPEESGHAPGSAAERGVGRSKPQPRSKPPKSQAQAQSQPGSGSGSG